MASYVLEEIVFCKNCGHDTLHRKNAKKMSWLMHLFLTVITAGLWLIVWGIIFLWHIINKSLTSLGNSWTCSKCGTKKLIGGVIMEYIKGFLNGVLDGFLDVFSLLLYILPIVAILIIIVAILIIGFTLYISYKNLYNQHDETYIFNKEDYILSIKETINSFIVAYKDEMKKDKK